MIKHKRIRKFTIDELKSLYWQFKKEIMTTYISYGGSYTYGGSGMGGYNKIIYEEKLIDFIIWLENREL